MKSRSKVNVISKKIPHAVANFAGLFHDPQLELLAAIVCASAADGYADERVEWLDEYLAQYYGVENGGMALALNYWRTVEPYQCENNLAELRMQQGWRQCDLAKRINAPVTLIAKIENLDLYPEVQWRTKIAKELGVTTAEIWPRETLLL